MNASLTRLLGDPMLGITALVSLGLMVFLAGDSIRECIERRKVRLQRARARQKFSDPS